MKKFFVTLFLLVPIYCSFSEVIEDDYVSVENESILSYPENKVLCEIVLNMNSGETTLGFIKKYALKLESKDTKEFLFKYGTSIKCYGRSFVYFVLYKGHLDDIHALLTAGYEPNWVIQDTHYRKMTMLDYLRILYNEETNEIYKDLIRKKILAVRRAGGRTCEYLDYRTCVFDKTL